MSKKALVVGECAELQFYISVCLVADFKITKVDTHEQALKYLDASCVDLVIVHGKQVDEGYKDFFAAVKRKSPEQIVFACTEKASEVGKLVVSGTRFVFNRNECITGLLSAVLQYFADPEEYFELKTERERHLRLIVPAKAG